MNEWCTYIALYCLLLYTQSALQSYGGGGGGGGMIVPWTITWMIVQCNVLLVIATPVLLKTGFVFQGHIWLGIR